MSPASPPHPVSDTEREAILRPAEVVCRHDPFPDPDAMTNQRSFLPIKLGRLNIRSMTLNLRRVLQAVLVTATMVAGLAVVAPATSAYADSWVAGCHNVDVSESVCIRATTGAKNYGNHTQWVGWVNPYFNTSYHDAVKLEAWGDGF